MPDVDLNLEMPSRHIHRGRSYTNVVFEPTNCLMVAASLMQAHFSSYDEDGNELWTPDGEFVPSMLLLTYRDTFIRPQRLVSDERVFCA